MEKVVSVGRACPASRAKSGMLASAVPPPVIVRRFVPYKICIVLIFATTQFGTISARSTFSVPSNSYNCSSNLICLGEAHEFTGDESNGIQVGRLSLLNEMYTGSSDKKGLAYYTEPVQLLDRSTGQPASFNTSFTIDMRYGCNNNGSCYSGDGMAFVISADNTTPGASGANLGIFNDNSSTPFKSIVVEFDTFNDDYYPVNDISYNHVSFDFTNITWRAAANASDVNVTLSSESTFYAWVEYSKETGKFEVRISDLPSRPVGPLLSYTVNLFDVVEEYMWVGFSSSSGTSTFSNYYVGDWKFESYGIPAAPVSSFDRNGTIRVDRVSSFDRNNHVLVLGITIAVPAFLLACICILLALYLGKSGRARVFRSCQQRLGCIEEEEVIEIQGMPERFSYKQLSIATKHFNEKSKLGQGGFGSVFQGVLPSSGIPVAVKKINKESAQGQKEFMTEVSVISRLRHRNLIQLLGWCHDGVREKYLVVYELMPNGSLDKVLFPGLPGPGPAEKETFCLSWQQRLNVVTGTAAALEYLHQGWQQQVIHRDIKSSNIMLDGEWNAKLGDFGLARLVDHQGAATTTTVAGTYGYIAPEAACSGHFTDKTDVFAFGAVVLEVACGRRAFLAYLPSEEMSLVDWVWRSLSEGDLLSAVDKRLEDYDTDWMEVVLILGLLCSHPNPLARPSMKHVVQVLAGDAPLPSIPISKPAPFSSEPHSILSFEHLHDLRPSSSSKSRSGYTSFVSTSVSESA